MAIIYCIFFIAGAAGLVCEVALNRMLVLLIGNTVTASAFIVMAFMAGLSLGSFWGGRFFSKRRSSLLPFIVLELLTGGLTWICGQILWRLSHSAMVPGSESMNWFIDHGVALMIPMMPAFLIGATFPAIVLAVCGDTGDRPSARAGTLYAFNTLGAAMGCALAGFLFLPQWGVQITFFIAAVLFFSTSAAAAMVLGSLKLLARRYPRQVATPLTSIRSSHESKSWVIYFCLTTFVIGCTALSYQILMIRIIILLFGNQTSVFSLVVTAFLLAIGLSALGGSRLMRRTPQPFNLYVLFLIIAGFLMALSPVFLTRLPDLTFRWILGRAGFQLLIWLVILLPMFLVGCLLPAAIYLLIQKTAHKLSSASGTLYACNCAGAIIGAGATNIFLVPWLGTQGALGLLAFMFLLAGLTGFWMRKKNVHRAVLLSGLVCLGLLVLFHLPKKTQELYVSAITNATKGQCETRLFNEGQTVTATILDCQNDGRRLFLNGVEEVTNRYYHVRLFKALGLLPVVLHSSDQPLDVLVIAFGAGITTDAVLDTDRARRVDAVDINPDVAEIQDLFQHITHDVLSHPQLRFIHADARHFLRKSQKQYSIIIADSTHPAAYDSWMLYTREFYQQIKNRLKTDGIFVQWIPLTINPDFLSIFFKTFTQTFPHSTFWQIPCSDQAFMIATPEPFIFVYNRIQARLDQFPDQAGLGDYELNRAEHLAGFFVMDTPNIHQYTISETRINTDVRPYNASRHAVQSSKSGLKSILGFEPATIPMYPLRTDILPYVQPLDHQIKNKIIRQQTLADNLQKYYTLRDRSFLSRAAEMSPESKALDHCRGNHPASIP